MGRRSTNSFRALGLLACLATAGACGGGGTGTPPPSPSPPEAPTGLAYTTNPALYRVGEAIAPNVATQTGGDPALLFEVAPALPSGLACDPLTGAITGTPDAVTPSAIYVVTASNDGGSTPVDVTLAVGPALPPAFESLAPGFLAEVVHEDGAPVPVKIARLALAPPADGRIFFTEVDTGRIRVIDPVLGLLPTPFATVTVLAGGHSGLLGLALAPDFASSGHVYALACVPAAGMQADRQKVFRWTDVGSVGTNESIVLDDLPIAPPMGVNNGGELLFDLTGMLLVSLGDTQDPAAAQSDAGVSLAGKVLRYDVSALPATAAAGNPFAGSPEWCRGLRNTFALAVHPTAGTIIGADNGPAADDELNALLAGKNFQWENASPPAPEIGHRIVNWPTVIVPTALAWHTGVGWGAEWANNLFMTTYEDHALVRLQMSGLDFLDLDAQGELARMHVVADDNHLLDVEMASDGSLYVSTFTAIYRITKP